VHRTFILGLGGRFRVIRVDWFLRFGRNLSIPPPRYPPVNIDGFLTRIGGANNWQEKLTIAAEIVALRLKGLSQHGYVTPCRWGAIGTETLASRR